MKLDHPAEEKVTVQTKRPYVKPMLSKIRLVAEEAVLAYCKTGNFTACQPNPVCTRVQRS